MFISWQRTEVSYNQLGSGDDFELAVLFGCYIRVSTFSAVSIIFLIVRNLTEQVKWF